MEALRLGLVLLAIVIGIRRRLSVGLTLTLAGPLTALLYLIPVADLFDGYVLVLGSERFLLLTGIVVLVTVLGQLLGELGFLTRLASACQELPGGKRTAVATLPLLVGLMPMPAGSLLSAPLVHHVLSEPKYTPHFKCAANYWFRHMAEFVWPIYPGLILTEAITGMPIISVAVLQLPLTLSMVVIGGVFFTARISGETKPRSAGLLKPVISILSSLWPVLVAILIYGVFKVNLTLAAALAVVLLIIVARPSKKALTTALKKGFSYKLILLVFGVLSFQQILEMSGSIEAISLLSTQYHLPAELVVFLVCYTIGVLTGMVSAYVGLGYVLLAGLLYQPGLNPGLVMLAYLSGFLGVMTSPAHLCLVFTNEFFGSDLGKVYRTLLPPLLFLAVAGLIVYFTGYANNFPGSLP